MSGGWWRRGSAAFGWARGWAAELKGLLSEGAMERYWGVRVGHGGKYAAIARSHGFIAIGWQEFGDLTWVATAKDEKATLASLQEQYASLLGVTGVRASVGAGQAWRFAQGMVAGDLVFVPDTEKRKIYVGRITGPYVYVSKPEDDCPYKNRRAVQWLADIQRDSIQQVLLRSLGCLTTVFNLDNRAEEIRSLLKNCGVLPGKKTVSVDVVAHVRQCLHELYPKQFEEFVAEFLAAIGFDAQPTVYIGDGGIDVAGTLDAQGLAQILLRVQVKRKVTAVGIETVLKTRGALAVDEQGAIITLGGFTAQARKEAEAEGKKTIALVEGTAFVEMILENWGKLAPEMQALLGVLPREVLPVRERFEVVRGTELGSVKRAE